MLTKVNILAAGSVTVLTLPTISDTLFLSPRAILASSSATSNTKSAPLTTNAVLATTPLVATPAIPPVSTTPPTNTVTLAPFLILIEFCSQVSNTSPSSP